MLWASYRAKSTTRFAGRYAEAKIFLSPEFGTLIFEDIQISF